jgi:3'-phosphoadenosine 5'-phosphosulfate (PAPS) 3'-phosphatase
MAIGNSKIFGIGLSKTGTTSLANALQILGYKTKDNLGVVKYATGDLSSVDLDLVDAFDALTDTPIPSFYRELDARFPESKFILTVRDSMEWRKSCKKQFTQRFAEVQTDAHKRLFTDLYGTDVFDELRFTSGYDRYVDGVRHYFKDRPHDLLIINIAAGEGWERLCPFLERRVPDLPFPKANVTQITWMSIDDLVAVARQGGLELMRYYDGASRRMSGSDSRPDGVGRGASKLLARTMRAVLGQDALDAALRAANKAILKGLNKLNPQIPMVSRAGVQVPYAERRHWNHLWLVDPLDGDGAFVNGTGAFSVNIALIEDGRPIYGVVYAPATDTAYYGRVGKGGYRRVQSQPPVILAQRDLRQSGTEAAFPPGNDRSPAPSQERSSHALSMCAVAEGNRDRDAVLPPSMEWQSAAAHAVLTSVGIRLRECDSGNELGYNKPDLANRRFTVA